jgi:hypothetical protein
MLCPPDPRWDWIISCIHITIASTWLHEMDDQKKTYSLISFFVTIIIFMTGSLIHWATSKQQLLLRHLICRHTYVNYGNTSSNINCFPFWWIWDGTMKVLEYPNIRHDWSMVYLVIMYDVIKCKNTMRVSFVLIRCFISLFRDYDLKKKSRNNEII